MSTVSSPATNTALLNTSGVVPAAATPAAPDHDAPAVSFSEVLNSLPHAPAPAATQTAKTAQAVAIPTSANFISTPQSSSATPTKALKNDWSSIATPAPVLPDAPVLAPDTAPQDTATPAETDPAKPNNSASAAPLDAPAAAALSASDACAANAKVLRAIALSNAPAPVLVDPLAAPQTSSASNAPSTEPSVAKKDVSDTGGKDAQEASDTPADSDTSATASVPSPALPISVFTPPLPVPVQTTFFVSASGNASDSDRDSAPSGQAAPIATSFSGTDQRNANAVRDLYAQTNTPNSNASPAQREAPDQAASAQLDPLRQLLGAMTPVNAPAPQAKAPATPTDDASPLLDSASSFTIRTSPVPDSTPRVAPQVKSDAAAAPSAPAPTAATYSPATFDFASAGDQKTIDQNPSTQPATGVVVAELGNSAASAKAQNTANANSPRYSAQLSGNAFDQKSVAAPSAPTSPAAASGSGANNSDSTSSQERQPFQASQLAPAATKVAKAETFAANAFSAVAPGGYWTEKTADTASVKAPDVLTHVVDALPKPLQATTITIRPEGYGTITIRVMPTPQDSSAPWRISIRTSDPSAHALLSQNVAELRQNLKGDPAHVFGSLKDPAQQLSATQETPMRQDQSSQNRRGEGGQRQDFEQRQRNRSRGFVFELPELDA